MNRFDFPSVALVMGPYSLEDAWGMKVAVAILDRSLDPGMHEATVQFDTFRKVRSALTNVHQASVAGMEDVIGAFQRNRTWISKVPTHSFWFATRFMVGIKRRDGEVLKQDCPLPIEVLHTIDNIMMEMQWKLAKNHRVKIKCTEMGTWFVVGFCSGLRGEEMMLIELPGTANSLKFLKDEKLPHFWLVVSGRTKGNRLSGARLELPIVKTTTRTYLQPGKWIKHLIGIIKREGRSNGCLFRRNLEPPKLCEFEDDFYKILEWIQSTTTFIDQDMDIREEEGILRTMRRGLTDHTRNMNQHRSY